MKMKYLLPVLACLTLGNNAWADETGSFDVGVKVGTLGAGAEINYPISPTMTIAVGLNSFSQSESDTIDGIGYDVDIDLQTISVLFNYHPFSGTFRITAGAMLNNNELSMAAKPNATYNINGNNIPAADVGNLEATVDFDNIVPYVGIGLGSGASSGLSFTLDVGVLLQGEPNVDLESTGGLFSNDPIFQAELAQEEKAAEDDIDGFDVYPVVAVGMSYRF
jgi:hypothetical protein